MTLLATSNINFYWTATKRNGRTGPKRRSRNTPTFLKATIASTSACATLTARRAAKSAFRLKCSRPFYRTWIAYLAYVVGISFCRLVDLALALERTEGQESLAGRRRRRTHGRGQKRARSERSATAEHSPAARRRRTAQQRQRKAHDIRRRDRLLQRFCRLHVSSEKLPAETLINALNEYFTAFDEIIGRYGLEKLKTIGDAYMFAGGLPNLRPSHAVDAVLAALEMAAVVTSI